MLVFRRNMWYAIQLPFSDPILTDEHKRIAAAVAANEVAKGVSVEVATATAEKTMYEKIYRVKNPSGKA
jgi:hypothetical protein